MTTSHPPHAPHPTTFLGHLREWMEALMLAFLVAMFFRMFVVELFRIPSGSMSPTLIGDVAADVDITGNGEQDQIVVHLGPGRRVERVQVFPRINGRYVGVDNFEAFGTWLRHSVGSGTVQQLTREQLDEIVRTMQPRYDKILVNKFAYWFRPPQVSDVIVFKVPPSQFSISKPIFIKRVAGVGGDRVDVQRGGGRLLIDGRPVGSPSIMQRVWYYPLGAWFQRHAGAPVPDDHFLAFGDNSTSSLDSRTWGPVPTANAKGIAFFRYWPMNRFGYLDSDI